MALPQWRQLLPCATFFIVILLPQSGGVMPMELQSAIATEMNHVALYPCGASYFV